MKTKYFQNHGIKACFGNIKHESCTILLKWAWYSGEVLVLLTGLYRKLANFNLECRQDHP